MNETPIVGEKFTIGDRVRDADGRSTATGTVCSVPEEMCKYDWAHKPDIVWVSWDDAPTLSYWQSEEDLEHIR
jgi:hypothetical protein